MRLRRLAAWVTVALAILVHLVAGIGGAGAQLCVCSSGVTIEQAMSGCCDPQPGTADDAQQESSCTDCHLIPLPDAAPASINVPPPWSPAATLPAPVPVATIVWPPAASRRPMLPRAHRPDPLPRLLRSVILTC
ncbi:MAG: hypothetical protein L6R48_24535 [Planctomycetes bacterium]|nr:hypothetical protein [Planctomycetota bacterium]